MGALAVRAGALIVLPIVVGWTGSTAFTETATLTRGPYLQRGTASGGIVRFRTDLAGVGWVAYGPAGGPLDQLAVGPVSGTEHRVVIGGLQPNTLYDYAVGLGAAGLAGGTGSLRTAPVDDVGSVRLWAVGDTGTGSLDAAAVRDAYLAVAGDVPADLWLLLGDNAYTSGTDPQYQVGLFDAYPQTLRRSWLWPALGNHDAGDNGVSDSPTLSGPFFANFSLPRNGEAGGVASGTEAYYSFDWGPLLHVVVLDSADSDLAADGPMATWLAADLAANQARWTIAAWHHPPYTKGTHDSDQPADSNGRMIAMRERFVPLLEAHGVDLVLSGHSHGYERSWLLAEHYGYSQSFDPLTMWRAAGDGDPANDGAYERGSGPRRGTVYAVVGSGAWVGPGTYDHPALPRHRQVLGSLVVDVSWAGLDARFIGTDGNVSDAFAIVDRRLFLDGFESGNLGGWSATVP